MFRFSIPHVMRVIHFRPLSTYLRLKRTSTLLAPKHPLSLDHHSSYVGATCKAHFSSTSRKMVKDTETVIKEFNELVNMSPKELTDWLGKEESAGSGWGKDDGSGETIGHESGRKIIKILEKNPKKDPEEYDEEDIDHMRRVVAYCKRHLAQEEKAKQDTDSKSYKSLKNWGHDAQKA